MVVRPECLSPQDPDGLQKSGTMPSPCSTSTALSQSIEHVLVAGMEDTTLEFYRHKMSSGAIPYHTTPVNIAGCGHKCDAHRDKVLEAQE